MPRRTWWLDPGHGGSDPGASTRKWWRAWLAFPRRPKIIEKDFVAGVGEKLAERIRGHGDTVYSTRHFDQTVSLTRRVLQFDMLRSDVVLSLHANSSGSWASPIENLGHGFEVWYDGLDMTGESQRLATFIVREFHEDFGPAGIQNRGIKRGHPDDLTYWYTFRSRPEDRRRAPAVLIEMNFVTHPDDTPFQTEHLNDSWAGAIFDAVNRFLGPEEVEEPGEAPSMLPAHEPHDLHIGTWEPMPDGGNEPVGLLAYAVNATDGRSISEMAYVAKQVNWRARSKVLFRIDYAPGQTCPQGDAQLDVFLDAVNTAFYPGFAGKVQSGEIIMSAFNEPNNPGEGSFSPQMVARAFNGRADVPEGSFCSKVRADRNGGINALIAAPAPNCYGSNVTVIPPVPEALESSPWNEWAWDFWTRIKQNAAGDANWPSKFDMILLHAYTRYNMLPSGWTPEDEPFADVRDSHGWRFGSNVTATWYETLRELKLDHLDIWIAEYTTHIDDSWPSDDYVPGTFPNFRDQALMTFGARLKAILWFVGPAQSPWERTAIYGGTPSLRDDYNALRKLRR